ncbi:MAG: amino acid permease [Sulfolobaceae archaeon]|nr:amino acid permease [Sulfolobaceae archaeon]
MAGKALFVRESSGLIKQVDLTSAIMLNLGNLSAGLALYESISPYISKGGVLWLASIIAFLFAIPQGIIYTIMTQKIGRTGGDYVWISRYLNGGLGSILALSLLLQSTAFYALVTFFSVASINTVLYTIGTVSHSSLLISLANNVFVNPYSSSLTILQRALFYGISALVFSAMVIINIVRAKWGYRLVTVLGTFSLLTLIIAMAVIALNSGDFFIRLHPFLQAINLTATTNRAFMPNNISLIATLSLLPLFALYTYPWINAGAAVSAEFKDGKVAKYNVFLALAITGLLVTGGFALMDFVAGYNFNLQAYPSGIYNFWSVAIALAGNPVLQWLIGLGLIVWNYFTLAYGVIVFSRYVFALSFDRVLPEKFTQLNRNGSPVYAHSLDLALTLILLLIPAFSISAALALYGATIVGAVYFFFSSLTGLAFGLKNSNKLMIASGAISSAYFAYLTYVAGTNPLFGFTDGTGVNPITLGFVVSAYLIGVVVYFASKYIHLRRDGIDISINFKEIPPE